MQKWCKYCLSHSEEKVKASVGPRREHQLNSHCLRTLPMGLNLTVSLCSTKSQQEHIIGKQQLVINCKGLPYNLNFLIVEDPLWSPIAILYFLCLYEWKIFYLLFPSQYLYFTCYFPFSILVFSYFPFHISLLVSHPLSSPSPPALTLSQHQGLFKLVSSSHQVAKVLEFHLQHQSFH